MRAASRHLFKVFLISEMFPHVSKKYFEPLELWCKKHIILSQSFSVTKALDSWNSWHKISKLWSAWSKSGPFSLGSEPSLVFLNGQFWLYMETAWKESYEIPYLILSEDWRNDISLHSWNVLYAKESFWTALHAFRSSGNSLDLTKLFMVNSSSRHLVVYGFGCANEPLHLADSVLETWSFLFYCDCVFDELWKHWSVIHARYAQKTTRPPQYSSTYSCLFIPSDTL